MSALLAQVRAESMKFRLGRMWWAVPAILVLSVAVFAAITAAIFTMPSLSFLLGDAGLISGQTVTGLVYSMATAVGYVVPLLLGALLVTSEYRHGTLPTTFAVQPRRGIVLAAKTIVVIGVGVVVGALGVATAVVVGAGVFAGAGADPMLGEWSTWRIVLATLVVMPIWAVIGLALGVLVRNQAAAIVIALAFTQFVEPLLRTLAWASEETAMIGAYLPGSLADAVVGTGLLSGMGSVGPGVTGIASIVVSPGIALLLLVAYAAVLLVLGERLRWRADVTS